MPDTVPRYTLYPATSEELLALQLRPTLCAVVPVPESAIVWGEFDALLAIVTEPVTVPPVVGAKVTFSVALWFGVRINPAFTPESLNPAPVTLIAEIVTFELPVFFSETFCESLAFKVTFPNATLEGLAVRPAVAAAPVPVNARARGEFGALLEREIEPVTAPAAVGPNATLNDADWPGCTVNGVVRPVTLKPVPVTLYDETVNASLPPFETITGCEFVWPTVTVPNPTDDGLRLMRASVPVPLNGTVTVGSELPLVAEIEMLPVALPEAVGVNSAVNVVLAPACRAYGSVMPLIPNPVPVGVIAVTFSLALPELEIVTVCFAVVPTPTLLNATVVGLTESAAAPGLVLGDCVGEPTTPAQPQSATAATSTASGPPMRRLACRARTELSLIRLH